MLVDGGYDRYDDERRNLNEYVMAAQSTAMAGQNLLLAAEQAGLLPAGCARRSLPGRGSRRTAPAGGLHAGANHTVAETRKDALPAGNEASALGRK